MSSSLLARWEAMSIKKCVPGSIKPITPVRLLVIGLMMVLAIGLATCVPSPLPLSEHPPTTVPTEMLTPSLPPTQSPLALPSNCPHMPLGGFYDVWRNEQVWPRLGCAVAPAEAITGTEAYLCDATHSLWLREKRLFVVVGHYPGPWTFVLDESGLPPDTPLMVAPTPQLPKPPPGPTVTPVPTPTPVGVLVPPTATPTPSSHPTQSSVSLLPGESGLLPEASSIETPTPQWPLGCFPAAGRHGWLARQFSGAESGGWARTSETTFEGAMQQFEGGWLLWNGNVCFVLFADGTWTMF